MKNYFYKTRGILHKKFGNKFHMVSILAVLLGLMVYTNLYADNNICKALNGTNSLDLVENYIKKQTSLNDKKVNVSKECEKGKYTVIFYNKNACKSGRPCILGFLYLFRNRDKAPSKSDNKIKINERLNGVIYEKIRTSKSGETVTLRFIQWKYNSNYVVIALRGASDGQLVALANLITKNLERTKIWSLRLDYNQDGKVTISDILNLGKQLFFWPGNTLIYYDVVPNKKTTDFFEVKRPVYSGFFSGVVSFIFWVIALVIIGVIIVIIGVLIGVIIEVSNQLERNDDDDIDKE